MTTIFSPDEDIVTYESYTKYQRMWFFCSSVIHLTHIKLPQAMVPGPAELPEL